MLLTRRASAGASPAPSGGGGAVRLYGRCSGASLDTNGANTNMAVDTAIRTTDAAKAHVAPIGYLGLTAGIYQITLNYHFWPFFALTADQIPDFIDMRPQLTWTTGTPDPVPVLPGGITVPLKGGGQVSTSGAFVCADDASVWLGIAKNDNSPVYALRNGAINVTFDLHLLKLG